MSNVHIKVYLLCAVTLLFMGCGNVTNAVYSQISPILANSQMNSIEKVEFVATTSTDKILLFRGRFMPANHLALLSETTPAVIDGCILLSGKDRGSYILPIWPPGFALKSGTVVGDIRIVDSKGIEQAQIGRVTDLGGGGVAIANVSENLRSQLETVVPKKCLQNIQIIWQVNA